MSFKFYIVMVEYLSSQDKVITKYFDDLMNKFQFELIRVRTDLSPGLIIENINEGYEFSGYQEGLARVISKLDGNQCNRSYLKIIFLNDTFFSSHFSIFSNMLISLLEKKKYEYKGKYIGIESSFGATFNSEANELIYISTWAFVLIGRSEDFKKIIFYDINEATLFYKNNLRSENILKYKNAIDEWLNPSKFMRGWYKSSLHLRLNFETLRRKQFAIYYEHTLANRLAEMGFEMNDVLKGESFLTLLIFKLLAFFDRLFLQYRKFIHRSVVNIQVLKSKFLGFLKK